MKIAGKTRPVRILGCEVIAILIAALIFFNTHEKGKHSILNISAGVAVIVFVLAFLVTITLVITDEEKNKTEIGSQQGHGA